MNNLKELGEFLKQQREIQDVSFKHLNDIHGLRYETVKFIEKGANYRIESLISLLNALPLMYSSIQYGFSSLTTTP